MTTAVVDSRAGQCRPRFRSREVHRQYTSPVRRDEIIRHIESMLLTPLDKRYRRAALQSSSAGSRNAVVLVGGPLPAKHH